MKLFILLLLLSTFAYGHGDHGTPGAIPPAPHGGVLAEAHHSHAGSNKHDHGKASKAELFFEGILRDGIIKVYPLEIDPKTFKTFIAKDITKYSKVKINLLDARKKQHLISEFETKKKFWEMDVKSHRTRRYILDVSAIYNGAKYIAKIQVERK